MARSPAFQLHVADFRQDPKTIRMNTTEIGAYFLLLLECWDKHNSLPTDIEDLADIARLPLARFQKMWEQRIERCFILDDSTGTYWHKRIAKEITKQDAWSKTMSEAGKKGALNRWAKERLNGKAIAKPYQAIASDNPTVKNEEDKNIHKQTACASENWEWPLKPLFDAFPELRLTPSHLAMIEQDVTGDDLSAAAWHETIATYRGNHDPALNRYDPSKVGTLLRVFKDTKAKNKRGLEKSNGTNRQNSNGNKQTPAEIIANRPYRTGNTD